MNVLPYLPMAPCFDNSFEPRARVVVVTISIAIGIEATISTTVKDRASTGLIPMWEVGQGGGCGSEGGKVR